MVWVACQPLAPGLHEDWNATASDLADHRLSVDRHPLPESPLLRRMPRRRQTDELATIIAAEVDIADYGAKRGDHVLDDGQADRLWIERASQRGRELLEPPCSLFAAVPLGDVTIRLEHVAA